MAAADATYTFKSSVEELAHRSGLLATFMSKPFADAAGCGAHTHVSLRDPESGRNLFADGGDPTGLSALPPPPPRGGSRTARLSCGPSSGTWPPATSRTGR